jgi:diaminopimelate decarboxylase
MKGRPTGGAAGARSGDAAPAAGGRAAAPAEAQPHSAEEWHSDIARGGTAFRSAEVVAAAPALRGALGAVAAAVLGDVRRVLHAHVARLRSDPQTSSARRMSERVLEDHLGTFIADLAQSLAAIDVSSATASIALRDGVAIQHVVAERHGRQRARLGWRADEVRREYQILREELGAAVRRAEGSRTTDLDQMIAALHAFIDEAERASLDAFTAAAVS